MRNAFLRFFYFLVFISACYKAHAQTTLIFPNGDGGFEAGNTFLLNGWRDVNGTQPNQWYCGTGATGYTGARCAYIGTAAGNNNYNINSASITHIYKDITFPAGQPNINLTFSFKGYGESAWDFIRVYLVPVATTPVAGTLLGTGQIGGDFNLATTWQSGAITLPCAAAGTTQRLVFTWRNDGSFGTMPAGAIDNVFLQSSANPSCNTLLGTGVVNVPSLPYNSGPGTTCGTGNNLTGTNMVTCGSAIYLTGEDQVWVFTPGTTGQVNITLSAPAASYTGLMLYAGCPVGSCVPATGTCVSFAQDFTGDKGLCANVTAGTTYYLVLDSWASPTCNPYSNLSISAVSTGASGNTCANAVSIPSIPYSVTGHTTACMGNEYTNATAGICNGAFAFGEDKVYSFTIASPQCIGIAISAASNNNIGYAVYQGCPGSGGVCIGSGGGATNGSLSGSVTLAAAGTYYIIIDTQSPSNIVNYNLQVTAFGSGAPNDRPYQAQPVPFNIPIAGSNNCSGNADEPAAPACFQPSGSSVNSVWFSFTAPGSGCVKIRTTLGTLSNTQMALYGPVTGTIAAGAGATLPLVACNQDLPPCGLNTYPSSQITFGGLAPGSTYYIMVDGYAGMTGTFALYVMDAGPGCTLNFPPTPGQDCEAAFPVCKTNIDVANPGPQAVGSNCEFSSNTNCLLSGERGSYWYRINIVSNGFLEFDIVPNDWPGPPSTACTDYDFAIWKTKTAGAPGPATCTNLGTVAPIRCNYNFMGVTGCYSAGTGTAPTAYPGFGAAYEQRIPVTAGDEYLLNVSNFTNSTAGFALDFSAGSPIATAPASGGTLVWTGSLNTDWYNPENWGGCAIPNCVYNVIIPSLPVNQPAITGLTAVCGSIDISIGSTLTLQANSLLKVCKNFTNNGTLVTMANSTVLMQSDSLLQNQTMSGAMTGANRIWNLTVNKPATAGGNTVTFNNDVDNDGNFLVSSGAPWLGGTVNATGRYHKVKGNFTVDYTAPPYAIYVPGTLEFNGTALQNYWNRGSLNNVVLNNSGAGVMLGNSGAADWMSVSGTLTLTQGRIITGANRVHVTNTAPASVTTGNNSSFVDGYLKRAFSPSGGSYDFPVGTVARGYQRLNFNFGGANDRSNATVSFNNAAPPVPMPYLGPDCSVTFFDQPTLNNGMWNVEPQPSNGVAPYSLTAYNNNYTNAQAGFTVMTKNGAAPWSLEGICFAGSTINAVQRIGLIQMNNPAQFATAQALTPLPVELLSLEARPLNSNIIVEWRTGSEINNHGFEIERATTPPVFKKIGWQNGSGTTSGEHTYSFIDDQVEKNKTYYYRLKQFDFDGEMKISGIVFSRLDGIGYSINALPNPYNGLTNIILSLSADSEVSLQIINTLGQVVYTPVNKALTGGTYSYEFGSSAHGLAKGVYTVKAVINGDITFLKLMELE